MRTAIKNSSFLMAAEIFSRIISFILSIWIVRILGAVDYGKFSFAMSLGLLFAVFSDLGINTIMVREIAREKDLAAKYVGNMLVLRFMLSVAAWLLIFTSVHLLGYPGNMVTLVCLVGCGIILNNLSEVFTSVFRAYEKMEFAALMTLVQRTLPLILGLLALLRGWGLKGLAWVYLFVGMICVLLSFIILIRKFTVPRIEVDFGFWRTIIEKSAPLGLSLIFTVIYFRISTIMLSKMHGDSAVGWFSASNRLIESLMFIPIGLVGAFFPVFSNLYLKAPQSLLDTSRKVIKLLLIIVLPVAVGTTILGDKIIQFLYGTQFSSSVLPLRILIWAEVIIFVNYVLTQLVVATNRQKYNAIFTFICSVFNVALNFLLIPKLSYIGASITSLATEGLLFVMCFYLIQKTLGTILLFKIGFWPLVSSLFMGAVILCLRDQPILVSIPLGALVYTALLYLLGVFSFESIRKKLTT